MFCWDPKLLLEYMEFSLPTFSPWNAFFFFSSFHSCTHTHIDKLVLQGGADKQFVPWDRGEQKVKVIFPSC